MDIGRSRRHTARTGGSVHAIDPPARSDDLDHGCDRRRHAGSRDALASWSRSSLCEALDRRLPAPTGPARLVYAMLAVIGIVLLLPVVVLVILTASKPSLVLDGVALMATGLATMTMWVLLVRGRPQPGWLTVTGHGSLLLAVVIGFVGAIPEVT